MGEAKRRIAAGEMMEKAGATEERSAYDFPASQFGRMYPAELEIKEQDGGGLLGLMELALGCAARERKGQPPGVLGCNYVIEGADGKARLGDFNMAGIMAPHGPERAAHELLRLLASQGAKRYAFYTNIRPASGNIPDIAVVGCEAGNTLGWVFDDDSFAAAGNARPVPKLITAGIVSWFTGLLDKEARPDLQTSNEQIEARHRRAIGDAAALLKAAEDHIRAVAHSPTENKNALVFDGQWRGQSGIYVVAFNDEIYEQSNIMSQPLLIIGTNIGIARSRNALLVEEVSVSPELKNIKQRSATFKISAMSKGRVLKESLFEAMRTSGGKTVVGMLGNAKKDHWWRETGRDEPALSALLHHTVQESEKDQVDPSILAHGTEVAEMKMRRHRMVFKRADVAEDIAAMAK